jgi:hypothetical protein
MDVLVSYNSCFHSLVSLITTMYVLVRVCVRVLGFYKLEALGALCILRHLISVGDSLAPIIIVIIIIIIIIIPQLIIQINRDK